MLRGTAVTREMLAGTGEHGQQLSGLAQPDTRGSPRVPSPVPHDVPTSPQRPCFSSESYSMTGLANSCVPVPSVSPGHPQFLSPAEGDCRRTLWCLPSSVLGSTKWSAKGDGEN